MSSFHADRWPWVVGGIGLSLVVAIVALLLWTEARSCEVTARSWATSVEVLRLQTLREGSWYYSVPADAREKNCYTKQSGTRKVKTGESCTTKTTGSGKSKTTRRVCTDTYTRHPVYDTWCDYTIDRYRHQRTLTKTGTGAEDVVWPDPGLGKDGFQEKKGDQSVAFALDFLDRGRGTRFHCNVPERLYAQLKEGKLLRLEVGVVTGNAWCDSITGISEMEE